MNNGESVFLLAIFIFVVVAWFAGGGMNNTANSDADVFVGPGTIMGADGSDLLKKKKWYEYLTFATSSENRIDEDEAKALNIDLAHLSPFEGKVTLSQEDSSAEENTPRQEYVVLDSQATEGDPIVISGWSIQSARGTRAIIPLGSGIPKVNVVNKSEPIALFPGESAYLSSGASPVGISFKESVCTGYFAQNQAFVPELARACPTAYDSWRAYSAASGAPDEACTQELRTLERCELAGNLGADVSQSCKNFAASELTYNGCVARYKNISTFFEPSWRVYFNSSEELYANTRDTLYLLDSEGLLVDTLSY